MTGFAIMDAGVIATLLQQIPLSARRVESHLEACNLPGRLLDASVGSIPLPAVERFISEVSNRIGDPNFMFHCLEAELPVSRDAVAGIPIPRRSTGVESVRAFAANIDACVTQAHFFSRIDGPRLWVLRTMRTTEWTGSLPVQLYNLHGILSGMRRLFGPAISPLAAKIDLSSAKGTLPEELRGIPILPAGDALGLAFPLMEVAMRGGPGRLAPVSSPQTDDGDGDGDTAELSACLATYLGNTEERRLEALLAGAFGMSPRSYRRRLAKRGTSHRELLDEARLGKALELLADQSSTLTDIALELGYSDRSHFTRFFNRRVGLSPNAYRREKLARDAARRGDGETVSAAPSRQAAARWLEPGACPYS